VQLPGVCKWMPYPPCQSATKNYDKESAFDHFSDHLWPLRMTLTLPSVGNFADAIGKPVVCASYWLILRLYPAFTSTTREAWRGTKCDGPSKFFSQGHQWVEKPTWYGRCMCAKNWQLSNPVDQWVLRTKKVGKSPKAGQFGIGPVR
jgi:hypothetical protein